MIRSEQFDDIYFSAQDGLAETRHVFLEGNDLFSRFAAVSPGQRFTVFETGFGTGLNFLSAWTAFEESGAQGFLDFVSVEKYPLLPGQIFSALGGWSSAFGGRLEALVAQYPMRIPGFHPVQVSDRVRLLLLIGDVGEVLSDFSCPNGVDAWFLDGFAPAKNPEMWTPDLFQAMARLSAPDACFATFTAAGEVRRGLEGAGFSVRKVPGYGRKREMLTGRLSGSPGKRCAVPRSVAVIGGGVSGSACVRALAQAGIRADLFERYTPEDYQKAAFLFEHLYASFNPRISAQRDTGAQFYGSAFALARRIYGALPESEARVCGTLMFANTDDKAKRFSSMCAHWSWPEAHARIVDAGEASEIAGVPVSSSCLYLPDAGHMAAYRYVAATAQMAGRISFGTPVREIVPVEDGNAGWLVEGERYDAVILSAGASISGIPQAAWLPVHAVRGQAAVVPAHERSAPLRCNLSYGGYILPAHNGMQIVGSTFQKWLDDPGLREDDHHDVFATLAENVPDLAFDPLPDLSGGTGFRCAAQDRFPIAGALCDIESWRRSVADARDRPNLYLSTAHGSHGLVSTLLCAEHIADLMTGRAACLPGSVAKALRSDRFPERLARKGKDML